MSLPGLRGREPDAARALALASALVVVTSFLTAFLKLTTLFGGTAWLAAYVGLALAAATLLADRVPLRRGLAGGVGLLAVGIVGYVLLLPPAFYGLFTPSGILGDVVGWVAGTSTVLMLEADLWAVAIAPAPTFVTWYLAVRRRYDAAVLVGGATLGFFVLTTDATRTATMAGMSAALATLGFGAIERGEGTWRQVDEVGLVVGLALLLGSLGGLARVVPARGVAGGGGRPVSSLEEAVVGDRSRLRVRGSISLTPEPRFTVRADRPAYWNVNSFDRYTGSGWRRTNEHVGAAEPMTPPPGETDVLQQTFVAESEVARMPFAWKPVLLGAAARRLGSIDRVGELDAGETLQPGDRYELVSAVSNWNEETLRTAGEEYPEAIERRYLGLPEDVPERLGEKAAEVAGEAASPYETAVAIQTWLDEEKSYSVQVDRPEWDVADAFAFAMDEGYCVYFATTMAVMLRTQGVPARFVAGYAPGEQREPGVRLLRGFHSHTWVEIYFPEIGWVPFDPTPAGGRERARRDRMERAEREGGQVTPFGGATATPTPTPTPAPTAAATPSTNGSINASGETAVGGQLEGPQVPERVRTNRSRGFRRVVRSGGTSTNASSTPTPSGDSSGGRRSDRLWLLGALATVAFGSVRLGYAQSAARSVWKRWQPRTDSPGTDVERALDRLEYHLAGTFRERREGETRTRFFRAARAETDVVDARAWRVLDLYYRHRYGDGVDEADADDAVELVDELVRG